MNTAKLPFFTSDGGTTSQLPDGVRRPAKLLRVEPPSRRRPFDHSFHVGRFGTGRTIAVDDIEVWQARERDGRGRPLLCGRDAAFFPPTKSLS
jgi:hypothetical protein